MEIDYINGPKTDKIFGMNKYQMEIVRRLDIKFNVIEYNSLMKWFEKRYGSDQETNSYSASADKSSYDDKSQKFFLNLGKKTLKTIDNYRYIRTVRNEVKEGNIKHIVSQELAYILNSIKLENNIVTCYDLIPWIYEKDRSSLWKENMKGLKQADLIITISKFSKDEIIKFLDYPKEKIKIVYPAVDHSLYYANPDKGILKRVNISNDQKILLYVGSELPRQNVPILVKALKKLKIKIPGIKLIKIGESQSYGARNNILKLIKDLDLLDDVIFVGYIPEEEMPLWYNAADILIYPCAYAGFGLPPLEAMACGTPVITSNTTSLPEVVGDAGIMIDPDNAELLADKMYDVLTNNKLKENLIKKGLKHSKHFNWDESAKKTLEIYKMMI